MKHLEPLTPLEPLKPLSGMPAMTVERWWPDEYGEPDSTGAQNALRYAFFRDARRLVIERDGHRATYDTGDHVITGVRSSAQSLVFSSEAGVVDIHRLKEL
jgi:hypothetical protein